MSTLRPASSVVVKLLAVAGAGLLLAELLVRWLAPQPLLAIEPGLYEADPPGQYRLSPGYRGTVTNGVEFSHGVTIDPRGFRSTGRKSAPASLEVPLVALLGDSFTFGRGVGDEETFAALLPQFTRRPLRVVNAGLPGIGVPRAVGRYQRHVRPLAPDVVVLVVFLGNDLSDARPDGEAIRIVDGLIAPAATPTGWRSWLYRRSHLVRLTGTAGAAPAVGSLRRLFGLGEPFAVRSLRREMTNYALDPPPSIEAARTATEEAIERLAATCRADGALLVAVLAPDRIQLVEASWRGALEMLRVDPAAYDPRRPQSVFVRLFERSDIPLLDLTPSFEAALRRGERLYFRRDRHWNASGHRLAAEEIGRFVDRLMLAGADRTGIGGLTGLRRPTPRPDSRGGAEEDAEVVAEAPPVERGGQPQSGERQDRPQGTVAAPPPDRREQR